MNDYIDILGISFSKLNLKETINLIDSKIAESRGQLFHIITVNPEIAIEIQQDSELKKISPDIEININLMLK